MRRLKKSSVLSNNCFIPLDSTDELSAQLNQHDIVLVLFGGQQCGVCHSIKPKLEVILNESFPTTRAFYVDCQTSTELCAQKGVMTLPVVQVYFAGQKFIEKARAFSLAELETEMKRIEAKMNSMN